MTKADRVLIISKPNNSTQLINRIVVSLLRALAFTRYSQSATDIKEYFHQNPSNIKSVKNCGKYLKTMINRGNASHFRYVVIHESIQVFPTFDDVMFHATENKWYRASDDLMLFIQEHQEKDHHTLYCIYDGIFQRNYIEMSEGGTKKVFIDTNEKNAEIHKDPISQYFVIMKM